MVVNVLTLNVTCIKDIIVDSLPMLFDRQTSTILCFLLLFKPTLYGQFLFSILCFRASVLLR